MKKGYLDPTEENIIKTLKRDLLKRNTDIVYFYNLLLSQSDAASIALDGRWGSGKTFFVKQSMLLINAKNPVSDMEEDYRQEIISMLPFPKTEDDIPQNYDVAIYYDAWENDNDTDPILSLVYEIVKQLGIKYAFDDSSDLFKLAGSIIEAVTGHNINGVIDNLKSETPLTKIKAEKDIHNEIKDFFTDALVERGERLVVFIDELDRCKPSYAVKLLEEIKHYLCDDRLTFVFSVNLEELQHTIKHYYGESFDACRYLDRFFDLRISLPPADTTDMYRELGLDSGYVFDEVCKKVIKMYDMQLREVSRFYDQVKAAVYDPIHDKSKWDFSSPDGKAKKLILGHLVPILIALKIEDISLYYDFVNGKNSKPIMDVYKDSDLGERLAKLLLNRNESFNVEEGKEKITVENKLQQLYDAVFKEEYFDYYHIMLGEYEFDENSKRFVRKVESMLSAYANYEL